MTPADPVSRKLAVRFLVALLTIDIVIVVVNVIGAPSFLALDEEKNFTTWYSSAKLLLGALAALYCIPRAPAEHRNGLRGLIWPAVAALFTALSMDETATAHERLAGFLMKSAAGDGLRSRILGGDAAKDSFIWPILFAPVIIAILYFFASVFHSRMRGSKTFILGLLGCAAFAAAILLEGPVVYQSAPIASWGTVELTRYQLLTVLEESAEVAGATLMLSSLLLHATRHDSPPDAPSV